MFRSRCPTSGSLPRVRVAGLGRRGSRAGWHLAALALPFMTYRGRIATTRSGSKACSPPWQDRSPRVPRDTADTSGRTQLGQLLVRAPELGWRDGEDRSSGMISATRDGVLRSVRSPGAAGPVGLRAAERTEPGPSPPRDQRVEAGNSLGPNIRDAAPADWCRSGGLARASLAGREDLVHEHRP